MKESLGREEQLKSRLIAKMLNYSLYTDLYQLTMAQGYFLTGKANLQACFSMCFRKLPFSGGYAIFCGSDTLMEIVEGFKFKENDIAYLKTLNAPSGGRLFEDSFLEYLKEMDIKVDVLAPQEGSIVFPYEPILRVQGSILQCQLLETALLNCINFQTLAATKAMRITAAAKGRAVAEFGLRRAQGTGGMWGARASYVGGFTSTSNVAAGKKFNIPVSGTHAHSWVMSFDTEIEAFREYAKLFPTNCTLLIDTYSVDQGIKNAITVAKEMKQRGQKMAAVRIDSGDLTWESRRVRRMLDEAGFQDIGIVLSNDLDEFKIGSMLNEGAKVNAFGVGTKFACCYDQPTLGGVYKLNAIKKDDTWIPKMKISESPEKTTIPGILNVKRFVDEKGQLAGDMVFDENEVSLDETIVDPINRIKSKKLCGLNSDVLLHYIMKEGRRIDFWTIEDARNNAKEAFHNLDYSRKRNIYPHVYPVGLEVNLFQKRDSMIKTAINKLEK